MIQTPLANIDSYIAFFSENELPVLRRTARALAKLREDEDDVNAQHIVSVVLQDPLTAMRLLSYLETHRRHSQNRDITTIDRAIMMMGITPFFEKFSNLPTVEERLVHHPKALVGTLKVITRARSAAQYARDWAVLRHDLDVDEVTVAALLHDAAELLFWSCAPDLMLRVAQVMQEA
ncbi:MAG TPA: HDOD domain-containing protein, partial [Rhodocyclaceae bacterium]|nr:HDOD domain-containing protein [Rhodocyclaceae bacterium]